MYINPHTAARMRETACEYIADADHLSKDILRSNDGANILRTLGLEILLKCAHLIDHGSIGKHGHRYNEIWDALKDNTRAAIEGQPANLEVKLKAWQRVFEKARYWYEENIDRTPDEVVKLGEKMMADDFKLEEADFAFYEAELKAFSAGLIAWIEARQHEGEC